MTMVIENQNRQYGGGMGFDSVYQHPHHSQPPQFSDPWTTAHSSSHSTPPVYPASVGIKQDETSRPSHIPMPYSVSVSAPSIVAGSNYSSASTSASYPAPDMMGLPHEIPRTSFDHAPAYTTAPSISSFAPASYAPISYASPVHQDNRRISHA